MGGGPGGTCRRDLRGAGHGRSGRAHMVGLKRPSLGGRHPVPGRAPAPPRRRLDRRPVRAPVRGTILLFTGVRYERLPDPAEPAAPRPSGAAGVELRRRPMPHRARPLARALLVVPLVAACAQQGDFGRPAPTAWNSLIDAAGTVAAHERGEPASQFPFTEDERALRDRAWRFLMPARESAACSTPPSTTSPAPGCPASWRLSDPAAYYEAITGVPFRSAISRYRRLSDDLVADGRLIPAFAETAARVVRADPDAAAEPALHHHPRRPRRAQRRDAGGREPLPHRLGTPGDRGALRLVPLRPRALLVAAPRRRRSRPSAPSPSWTRAGTCSIRCCRRMPRPLRPGAAGARPGGCWCARAEGSYDFRPIASRCGNRFAQTCEAYGFTARARDTKSGT